MKRIVIFRGGAVGDFIVTLPVFAALRRQWPESHITLVSYPRVKRLALETGLADEFRSLDAPEMARLFAGEEKNRGYGGCPQKETASGDLGGLLLNLPSFELVLSYLHDPDGVVRANLARAGARRIICASPLPAPGRHVVDHLLAPLTDLGMPESRSEAPCLKLDPRPSASRVAVSSVALHPGSGSPKKNWPTRKFAELAQSIRDQAIGSPFFSLGEADDAVAEELARRAPEVPVVQGLDLIDLAIRLAGCQCYVGNDSGITHLAAAVGIPVVALFGPSDPAVWGPRGPKVKIIHAAVPTTEGLIGIETHDVLGAVKNCI